MKEWCLGFIITPHEEEVILLKKSKTMHIGLWNGVGGKLENNESAHDAMKREGLEEAGFECNWKHVGYLAKEGEWRVFIYAARGLREDIMPLQQVLATSTWGCKPDTPYRVPMSELASLKLAPHTRNLIYMAQDKLLYPNCGIVQLSEVS